MDVNALVHYRDLGAGAALGLSAAGSALGAGMAGMAAIGAWKKCLAQNKNAPFLMAAFVGAPLSQTIYGMILMNAILTASSQGLYLWWIGLFAGLAIGMSAWTQGLAGASASDAFGETGKGFGNYLIVLGIIETVAIFTMVFSLMAIGKMGG
jgi:V/A-type H+-transporting ATPase subunit K